MNGRTREDLLRAVIAGRAGDPDIARKLALFGWDSDHELVVLTRRDVVAMLERYLRAEVTADDLSAWADSIEGCDDIGFEQSAADVLRELIFELANPEITRGLTTNVANDWKRRLLASRPTDTSS